MKDSLIVWMVAVAIALFSVAVVEARDDGGRCPVCGKQTLMGGSHICKPRKKSRPQSFWVQKKEPEKTEPKVENKPVPIPPELKPLEGTYAEEVISTTSRTWTDNKQRKIEASWMHVSQDYARVYLKSVKTGRRLNVNVSDLSERDRQHVREYISGETSKSNIWLRGVFVSAKDVEAYHQREEAKAVIRAKDQIVSKISNLKVFQVLEAGGALCRQQDANNEEIDGPVKYIPSTTGLLADGDSIKRRFIWCGTYNYETRGRYDRTVHCLTDDPKFAIEQVVALMNKSTEEENPTVTQKPPVQSGALRPCGTGSGFFVTEDGYLITNHHVVEDGEKFAVLMEMDGKAEAQLIEAKLIRVDRETDLALLKCEGIRTRPFRLSSRRTERLATPIFTMGFPKPGDLGFDPKVTRGIISGENGFRGEVKQYQIDATIQPGNSGGPVFNEHGCVIGVAVAVYTRGQCVSWCVKKSYLLAFIDGVPKCSQGLTICEDCSAAKKSSEDIVADLRKSCVLVVNYQ